MYTPDAFAEHDPSRLFDAMDQFSFALVVSSAATEPVGSHIPLLLDRSAGPQGTLFGHVARANPHWQSAAGQRVLAVFSGPHAYISPRWYEAERTVPTWNYVAVHAYGVLEILDKLEAATDVLRRMVDRYEQGRPSPWSLAELPADFLEKLATQIVPFRIPIDRLEGKWKLNQNHPAERRLKVITALLDQADPDSHAIARLMQE